MFGAFPYRSEPRPGNPERIVITGDWTRTHLVTVTIPQLARFGVRSPVTVHYRAREPLRAVWADWEAEDLLHLIPSWDGLWVPRYKRQAGTVETRIAKCALLGPGDLSNHSWGTAFDIGAARYPLGHAVPAHDPWRALFPVAVDNGWFPGADFARPDGMHFELAACVDSA